MSSDSLSSLAKPTSRGRLTPNEIRSVIHDLCAKHKYDPFEELIKLASETHTVMVDGNPLEVPLCDVDQRIMIAKEIAPYLAPKLKSIEVSGDVHSEINITVQKFADMAPPITLDNVIKKELISGE